MLAASYQAMGEAYRDRERVFAGVMADRADWEAATRAQRHLAVAADAELRRRHPEQRFTPLRSAEPPAATDAQRAELTLTTGQDIPEAGQWIKDLTAGRRTFAEQARRPAEPDHPRPKTPNTATSARRSRPGPAPRPDAILQPPKPEIRPSARVLERVADRDADIEAGE